MNTSLYDVEDTISYGHQLQLRILGITKKACQRRTLFGEDAKGKFEDEEVIGEEGVEKCGQHGD